MNKVYLVICIDYSCNEGCECYCSHPSDRDIKGLFSSKEKAQSYITDIGVEFGKVYEVEEMEVK